MEQQTPTKPVMDVMPPKPVAAGAVPPSDSDTGPDAHGNPSSVLANAAATGSVSSGETSMQVHAAPAMTDDDRPVPEAVPAHEESKQSKKAPAPVPHTAAPKPHGPALAILGVVLGMVVLSGLAILVYLNS